MFGIKNSSLDEVSGNFPLAVLLAHRGNGLNRFLLALERSVKLQDHVFAVGCAGDGLSVFGAFELARDELPQRLANRIEGLNELLLGSRFLEIGGCGLSAFAKLAGINEGQPLFCWRFGLLFG